MFKFIRAIKSSAIQGTTQNLLDGMGIPKNLVTNLIYNPLSNTIFDSVLENTKQLGKGERGVIGALIILEFAMFSSRDNQDASSFYNEKKFILMSALGNDLQNGRSDFDSIAKAYCRSYEDAFGVAFNKADFENQIQATETFNQELNFLGL